MNRSPFKFLDSYTQSDKDIFFGREKEIEEVYSRLFHSKLLLIYGPSGSGKTSLLQCGVSNKFGEHNWKPIFIRCKENINESVHAELDKHAITPFKKEKSITEKLYSLYLDYLIPVYLIFDQFEELFIFGDANEKREFVNTLKDILSNEELSAHVILSIREEYLASLSEFEDELPQLFDNRIRIEKMKKSQALSVILSPCEICNVTLETSLAESALERIVSESATIELTWLQVLMDRLYKSALTRKEETVEIKLSDLEALGKIGDVLGNFLDEQLQQMPDGKNGEAILKTLITSESTKRQLNIDEIREALLSNGYKLEPEVIRKIVQHFVNVRILSDKDENDRYELKHDSLAAKIFERLTLAEKELQEVRQFVENAFKSYQKTEHLLGVKELKYVTKYEDKLFLKDEPEKFINESKQILSQRKRVQRRVKVFAIISFFLLIFSFGYWAIKELKEYSQNWHAISALLRKNDDPIRSLDIAIKAYQKYKSPLTSKALFESFYELWNKETSIDSLGNSYSPYNLVFDYKPCHSEILFADYSVDGEYIYGYLADTSIIIWTQFGKQLFNYKVSNKPVLQIKMSPDNKHLTCFNSDSIAFLFEVSGKVLCNTKIVYDLVNPSRVMAFSPDNKFVAYVVPGNKTKILTTEGRYFQELNEHTQPLTSIDFSNNGQFLATASKDSTIILYYFNHEKDLFNVYNIIDGHKDIVWSVDFADNGKYLISASEDSTIGIWDFNGNNLVKEEKYSKFFDFPKTKFSNVFFSPEDNMVVYKQCDTSSVNSGNIKWYPWDLIFTIKLYNNSNIQTSAIKFSSSGFLYQTSSGEIRFLSNNLKKYCTFIDEYKLFSANHLNMFGIYSNYIRFYPINEEEIIRLTKDKLIFGRLKIAKDDYKDLQYF
jgi:WD40 repeat protein